MLSTGPTNPTLAYRNLKTHNATLSITTWVVCGRRLRDRGRGREAWVEDGEDSVKGEGEEGAKDVEGICEIDADGQSDGVHVRVLHLFGSSWSNQSVAPIDLHVLLLQFSGFVATCGWSSSNVSIFFVHG